jgi:hypothetical protein
MKFMVITDAIKYKTTYILTSPSISNHCYASVKIVYSTSTGRLAITQGNAVFSSSPINN